MMIDTEGVADSAVNAFLAEKAMGWWHWGGESLPGTFFQVRAGILLVYEAGRTERPWSPTSDIVDAWDVLLALRKRFGMVELYGIDDPKKPGKKGEHSDLTFWECIVVVDGEDKFMASGETAELAISRVAVKALLESPARTPQGAR